MKKALIPKFTFNEISIVETALESFKDDLPDLIPLGGEKTSEKLIISTLNKISHYNLQVISNEELCITYDAIKHLLDQITDIEENPENHDLYNQVTLDFISHKSPLTSAAHKIKQFLSSCGIEFLDLDVETSSTGSAL